MEYKDHLPLAPLTSFKCGGEAEKAVLLNDVARVDEAFEHYGKPDWILGYGCNSLVSDHGLPGTTYLLRQGDISINGDLVIADAGVWWDDLVSFAIDHNLWGLECMSAIPGGVGAAVVGNIAAYGQAVSDTLEWAEICDVTTGTTTKYAAADLALQYRKSAVLQTNRSLMVLRAAFRLHAGPSKPLEYESALVEAREYGYDVETLDGRRQTIIKAREKAGSLWDYRDEDADKTAGSFFRNPMVDAETAHTIMSYDETGKSLQLLEKMNKVHGGDASRVSAAHVLLAAGFQRGQNWGDVRLHPKHVLKLENAGHASAQEIYDVSELIQTTVREKLGVELDPEIRFLGSFSS